MASSCSTASEHPGQNLSQSMALVVGVCLAVVVGSCFASRVCARRDRWSVQLESRINPNTAGIGSMVRLPGIGLTRAQAIIAFRARTAEETGNPVVFGCPADLMQVRGIGPKTVEGLARWLRFEGHGEAGSASGGID